MYDLMTLTDFKRTGFTAYVVYHYLLVLLFTIMSILVGLCKFIECGRTRCFSNEPVGISVSFSVGIFTL